MNLIARLEAKAATLEAFDKKCPTAALLREASQEFKEILKEQRRMDNREQTKAHARRRY